MTWNIEGFARNVFNLKELVLFHMPDLVFLSEPQSFQCDIERNTSYFHGLYTCKLNSADQFDLELPLIKSKASGGTMVMWKKEYDPFITLHPPPSPAILPLIFHPPACAPTIHLCVYLPTHGKDCQFLNEVSNLSTLIHDLRLTYPDHMIYIRGDFNINEKNLKRMECLDFLKNEHHMNEVKLNHPTYHHFTGNGTRDSNLDRILFSTQHQGQEKLIDILCKHDHPLVNSTHDVILTSWLPLLVDNPIEEYEKVRAPKIENTRHRIVWSDDGITAYQKILIPHLRRLQDQWLSSPTSSCLSLLLSSTNNVLTSCSKLTNKTIELSEFKPSKTQSTPVQIRLSSNRLRKMARKLKHLDSLHNRNSPIVNEFRLKYNTERTRHRKLCRMFKARETMNRDARLLKDPSVTFTQIRRSKRCQAGKLHKLTVGQDTFYGDTVPDGFYTAISQLKMRNETELAESNPFCEFQRDYENIMKLSYMSEPIKAITELEALKILNTMKPDVSDLFSITPNHYLNAGPAGCKHFFLLLSALISEISSTSIEEVNSTYAVVLFKGHGKDRSSAKSYRTISTCPVVAKALDMYIRDLYSSKWNERQIDIQFQGQGSSHELAALLLTECIEFSQNTLKEPTFVLYLDAASAFDVVQKELLIKSLYSVQELDQSFLYLNNRLSNRQTFVDWNGNLMGPIRDEQGLEQGGTNSSDHYKIFCHEQLLIAQRSGLGVPMGEVTVSAIGQADDIVLVSNRIQFLFYLLLLTISFCEKHQIKLGADKTKLQV